MRDGLASGCMVKWASDEPRSRAADEGRRVSTPRRRPRWHAVAMVRALALALIVASSVASIAGSSTGCSADTPAAAADTAPSLAQIRARAHDVLARRCGECHEAHRPTAKQAALAIFDLDKADWPSRFDERRYAAALRRLGTSSEEDTAAIRALRDASKVFTR